MARPKGDQTEVIGRLERGDFVGFTPDADEDPTARDRAPSDHDLPDTPSDDEPSRKRRRGGRPARRPGQGGDRAERTPAAEAEAARLLTVLRDLLGRVRASIRSHRGDLLRALRAIQDQPFFERNAEAVDMVNCLLQLFELQLHDPDDQETAAYLVQADVPGTHGGNIVLRTRQSDGRPRRAISARTRMPNRLVIRGREPVERAVPARTSPSSTS